MADSLGSINGYKTSLSSGQTDEVMLSHRVLESLRTAGAALTWSLVVRLRMQERPRAKQAVATALQHLEREGLVSRLEPSRLWVAL